MHRDTIEKLLRVIDAGSFDDLTRIFHPDICYARPGYQPIRGLARVLFFYTHERIIASGVHHIQSIVTELSAGACWGRFIGRSKDGKQLDESFADVYRFEDGLIVERQTYFYRPAI